MPSGAVYVLPTVRAAHLAPGQIWRVLPPPGGPVTPGRAGRQHLPAHARTGDLLVQLAVQRVQLGRVVALVPGPVALGLGLGALLDQPALPVVRVVRVNDRLMIEMPAFPALGRPQHPGPFSARSAHRGQGVPARDEDLFHPSGADIGAAELHRPQAGPVLGRDLPDHGPRERHRHPLGACPRPRLILCPRLGHQSPPSPSAGPSGRSPHMRHSQRRVPEPSSSRNRPAPQVGQGSSVRHAVSSVTGHHRPPGEPGPEWRRRPSWPGCRRRRRRQPGRARDREPLRAGQSRPRRRSAD